LEADIEDGGEAGLEVDREDVLEDAADSTTGTFFSAGVASPRSVVGVTGLLEEDEAEVFTSALDRDALANVEGGTDLLGAGIKGIAAPLSGSRVSDRPESSAGKARSSAGEWTATACEFARSTE
jgi:hypothetical protein